MYKLVTFVPCYVPWHSAAAADAGAASDADMSTAEGEQNRWEGMWAAGLSKGDAFDASRVEPAFLVGPAPLLRPLPHPRAHPILPAPRPASSSDPAPPPPTLLTATEHRLTQILTV